MSASRVAIRYARAFVEALAEKGQLEDHKSFLDFTDLVASSKELSDALSNVAIKPDAKANIIKSLAGTLKLPELVNRFLLVLAQNRRLEILPHLKGAVTGLVNEHQKVQAVKLVTAKDVSSEELDAFSASMSRVLGTKVDVETSTDSNLIGGAVAHVGSFVYDGSVRGHLARLRQQLVKES